MSFSEIEEQAVALSERDREKLIRTLLETLPPRDTDVSDEEVAKRDWELESGLVKPISHAELVRRIKGERRRRLSSSQAK